MTTTLVIKSSFFTEADFHFIPFHLGGQEWMRWNAAHSVFYNVAVGGKVFLIFESSNVRVCNRLLYQDQQMKQSAYRGIKKPTLSLNLWQ